MKLCNTYRLHLISDEIYGLSVWDNPKVKDNVGFTSILSIDAAQFMDPSMVHVVWGLSKVGYFTYLLNTVDIVPNKQLKQGFWCDRYTNGVLN